jgi:hypothetical protein
MAFQRHDWISYGNRNSLLDIRIKDESGNEIDRFRCNNKKEFPQILKVLKEKYGYSDIKEVKESIKEEKKKDIDWLKKDMKW